MGKKFEVVGGDISDGYHTFGELYDHRCLLYVHLCVQAQASALRKGEPGVVCFKRAEEGWGGWFLLVWESPAGQISYHLPEKLLWFVEKHFPEKPDHEWDGHTSHDVIQRMSKLLEM